jgi:cobalt/nickel transport system permease protein
VSHIHIPDGVLPLWIILAGWVVTAALLLPASRQLAGPDLARRLPLVGMLATFMIVTQSLAVPPLGFHLNLTVLSGILLGPGPAFIAVFIVNLFLALFGHGGITVVGLNALVLGSETLAGGAVFRWLARGGLDRRAGLAAAAASLAGLLVGASLTIGIVASAAAAPGDPAAELPERLVLPNPFGAAPLVLEPPETAIHEPTGRVAVERFAALVLVLGLVGWPIEAAVTGLVVAYLQGLRPDLLPSREARQVP